MAAASRTPFSLTSTWNGPCSTPAAPDLTGAAALLVPSPAYAAAWIDRLRVGAQPDGRILVPTNQLLRPAGKQITFPGRPVDLALADGGKTLVVKNLRDLLFIDTATATIRQT